MSPDFKQKILAKLLEKLESEMQVMISAALIAREAATHEESKAEDKYDTRGLEASYLAGAQAKRASELQRIIHSLQELEIEKFKKSTPITTTALVEVVSNSKKTLYFVVPKGGGIQLEVEEKSIQILTPDSRLGKELMGKVSGDSFDLRIAEKINEYEITNIY